LGCNIAWGLVDAVVYIVTRLTERGRALVTFRAARAAVTPEEARRIILGALPAPVASTLSADELDAMHAGCDSSPSLPGVHNLAGGLPRRRWSLYSRRSFNIPGGDPFFLISQTPQAMRLSNAIAVVMLFLGGYHLARYSGNRAWLMGLSMALVGIVLVGLTIALGG